MVASCSSERGYFCAQGGQPVVHYALMSWERVIHLVTYTRGVQGRRVAMVEALVGHVAWVAVEQDRIHYSGHQ